MLPERFAAGGTAGRDLGKPGGRNVSAASVVYLNRFGDLLFVLARAANQLAGQPDVPWQKTSEARVRQASSSAELPS